MTTVQEHQEIRRKYTQLAWQLWRSQYQAGFIVKHPIPEEHLRIEIRAFLEGRISEIHGFADPLGQAKDAIIAAIKPAVQWVWDFVIKPAVEWGLEATGWLGSKIQALVKPGLNWLWSQIQGFFSTVADVLKEIGSWIITGIKKYVIDPFVEAVKASVYGLKSIADSIRTIMLTQLGGLAPQPIEGFYEKVFNAVAVGTEMSNITLIGSFLLDLTYPTKQTTIGDLTKWILSWSWILEIQHIFINTTLDIAVREPLRQDLNRRFQYSLPGMGDLIRFMVREVFREDIVALYRMDEDYPPQIEPYAARLGYSPFWCKAYWRAHWELPSVQQGYTMFHRGVIDRPTLEALIRTLDIMPFWRDKLIEISYELIPRVDLRRAWEAGIISDDELLKRMKWLGYSDEDARIELLTQKRVALAAEISDLERLTERRFRKGYITLEQAKAELSALGYHSTRIEMRIQYYNLLAEEAYRDAFLDLLEDLYSKDLITDEDLQTHASQIIARKEILDLYLQKCWLKKYKKPKTAISIKLAE